MGIAMELFIIGMISSAGPCLVSCSPVIIPYIAATRKGWKEGLVAVSAFLAGRMAVYSFLGLVAGFAGRWLVMWLNRHSDTVYFAGGLLVMIIGASVIFNAARPKTACSLRKGGVPGSGVKGPALLGLTVGILPCLPLLGVLAYISLSAENVWLGAFYGAAFGAGKFISPLIPIGMLAGSLSGGVLSGRKTSVLLARVCGAAILFIGASLMIRQIWK